MDSASAWFADRAYNQSDNIYYIGYATEVAIGAKNPEPEAIEKYGEKFIADEQFPKYWTSSRRRQGLPEVMPNIFTDKCIQQSIGWAKRPKR